MLLGKPYWARVLLGMVCSYPSVSSSPPRAAADGIVKNVGMEALAGVTGAMMFRRVWFQRCTPLV